MKKIDFTLIKSLVNELEELVNKINIEPKTPEDKMKAMLELAKASGLAAYTHNEAAALSQDVALCIKHISSLGAEQENMDAFIKMLTPKTNSKGNN